MRKYLHVSCVDKSLGPHQLHSNNGWCKISQPEQSIYFALVYLPFLLICWQKLA